MTTRSSLRFFQHGSSGLSLKPTKLSATYRAVLKTLSANGMLVGKGTFAFLFHVKLNGNNYVVKVPRYNPSQRIAICLNALTPAMESVALPQGHYLYLTLTAYIKREKDMLEAASHRLPRLFRIVRPQTPKHPQLESVSHIVMLPAVMTLQNAWLQHKSGNLSLTNIYLIHIARQLLLQLTILHHRGMTHGDLRLANFLMFRSPTQIKSVRFNLGPDFDCSAARSTMSVDTVVDVHFQGDLGLVKFGDYGNAFYLDAHDKNQHRRQYDLLETALFQDLDSFDYAPARKVFWYLRDQLLTIKDVARYPHCTYITS